MQYVTDDMDDLFRRAAESYPLDTHGANWDHVAAVLEGRQAIPARHQKDRKYFWLLLLLPLAWICRHNPYGMNGPDAGLPGLVGYSTQSKTLFPTRGAGPAAAMPAAIGFRMDSHTGTTRPSVSSIHPKPAQARTTTRKNVLFVPANRALMLVPGQQAPQRIDPYPSTISFTPYLPLPAKAGRPAPAWPNAANHAMAPVKKNPSFDRRRFYAGLVGGLDASSVKGQKLSRAGYDYGLLAGYELGGHWSMEAGLFFDRKYYYTESKYFNTAKVYTTPYAQITDISGSCRMIEVPVGVRYAFTPAKRSSWFLTVGISSYLMQREDYSYLYYYPGPASSAWHSKSYDHASKDLFAEWQLSGGFTRSIGRAGTVRIEPYLKLPLSGVGLGNLPLSSAGLHVGYLRKIF